MNWPKKLYDAKTSIVTNPVVDTADVAMKRLSKKPISVLWNRGIERSKKPTTVYKKKPQTRLSCGDLLILIL